MPAMARALSTLTTSWRQLLGGKRTLIESTSPGVGGNHFPTGNPNSVPVPRGWDLNTLSTSILNDGVNHYYFTLDAAQAARYSLTATLVWNRHASQSGINNLDLFLYDTANSNLVVSSQSSVDNVEHLFLPSLPAGRYDLQVLQHGGLGTISASESYALAFDFEPVKLAIAAAGSNVLVSWPVSAAGFNLQTTADVNAANGWSAVTVAPGQTNGQYVVQAGVANAQQFFRLKRP